MDSLSAMRCAFYTLMASGRHLLWSIEPVHRHISREALESFIQTANACQLPTFVLKSILSEILIGIDRGTIKQIPSLVDRFTTYCHQGANCLDAFMRCTRDLLRYGCVAHPTVRHAIVTIEERFGDARFSSLSLSTMLGVRQSSLDVVFRRETQSTPTEYLREVRLSRALVMLTTTALSIKEIWAAVGYNDPSTFDHHFKRRYGMTPTDARRRGIVPPPSAEHKVNADTGCRTNANSDRRVLIIDTDALMRVTIATRLSTGSYNVVTASTGAEGVEIANAFAPDVILLDWHITDMDGMTCLAHLGRDATDRKRPILVFIADLFASLSDDTLMGLGAKAYSQLCDPLTVQSIIDNESRQVDSRSRSLARPSSDTKQLSARARATDVAADSSRSGRTNN